MAVDWSAAAKSKEVENENETRNKSNFCALGGAAGECGDGAGECTR